MRFSSKATLNSQVFCADIIFHRTHLALIAVFCSLLIAAQGWAQTNAIVLDSEGQAVAFLDLHNGIVTSRVTVPFGAINHAVVATDGGTILVIDDGHRTAEMRDRGLFAILTREKVINTGDLGWGFVDAAFSIDGRLAYVLTEGEDPRRPSELVRIDAVTGKDIGRLSFNRSATALGFDPGGSTAIVYSPRQWNRTPEEPARLIFIDLANWEERGSFDIPGAAEKPIVFGELWYLVDPGERGRGKVHVIDTARRTIVNSIDVGSNATAAELDRDGNLFVLSRGSSRNDGRVTIVRGADVVGTYATAGEPSIAHLSKDGKRLYVVGKQLGVVDLDAKSVSQVVDVPRRPLAFLATRNGRRVVTISVNGQECCRVSVFDMTTNRQLTSFLGGSKGSRIGQVLGTAVAALFGMRIGPELSPAPTARGSVAFGPHEKTAYAIDTFTNGITGIDLETGQRTVHIAGGWGLKELVSLPDANLIAAVSHVRIDLIHTATHQVRSIALNGGVNGVVVTPDETRLVVYGKKVIAVLDMKTGRLVGMIEGLVNPSQIVFDR